MVIRLRLRNNQGRIRRNTGTFWSYEEREPYNHQEKNSISDDIFAEDTRKWHPFALNDIMIVLVVGLPFYQHPRLRLLVDSLAKDQTQMNADERQKTPRQDKDVQSKETRQSIAPDNRST